MYIWCVCTWKKSQKPLLRIESSLKRLFHIVASEAQAQLCVAACQASKPLGIAGFRSSGSPGCGSHLCCVMSNKTEAPGHWVFLSPTGAVNVFFSKPWCCLQKLQAWSLSRCPCIRRCVKYSICLCVRAALSIVTGSYNFQSVEHTLYRKTLCQKGSTSSVCLLWMDHWGWNAAWTLVWWCCKLQTKYTSPSTYHTSVDSCGFSAFTTTSRPVAWRSRLLPGGTVSGMVEVNPPQRENCLL